MWKTSWLTDKSQILAFLETDRLYAAYAIGDLEAGLFEQCSWAGAEEAGRLQALVLHFRGLKLSALVLMGDADGLRALLGGVCRPERVYLTCRPEHLPMTREFYTWDRTIPMWRMVLRPARFRPAQGDCVRLGPGQAQQLAELYSIVEDSAFAPAQMEHGVFCGVLVEDRLVAAAGTHLISPTYGVAAVGNVATHPDYRGRGYATATTGAVVAELLRHGIPDIILNVGQYNRGAIRIYERLGFERYCPFLEGPASARRIADAPEPGAGT